MILRGFMLANSIGLMLLQNGYCRDMGRSSAGLNLMVQKCVRQGLGMVMRVLGIEMLQLFSNLFQRSLHLFGHCVRVFRKEVPGILYRGASCVFRRHTSMWVVLNAITFSQSWHLPCSVSEPRLFCS